MPDFPSAALYIDTLGKSNAVACGIIDESVLDERHIPSGAKGMAAVVQLSVQFVWLHAFAVVRTDRVVASRVPTTVAETH